MKNFLAFAYRNRHLDYDTTYRLRCQMEGFIPYRKSQFWFDEFVSPDRRYCVFFWTNEEGSIMHKDESGCACLIGYARRGRSLLSCSDLYRGATHSKDRVEYFRCVGGVYAYFEYNIKNKSFAVCNTPGRLHPTYYGTTEDIIACGNRAMMVSTLLNDGNPVLADLEADQRFSFFLFNGYYGDHSTPFSGVNVLESDTELVMQFGDISKKTISELEFHDDGKINVDSELCDQLASTLVDIVIAIGSAGVNLTLGLTGGKDSRLLFSALLNSGLLFKTRTNGYTEHPDVIIAQEIAKYYNIEHELITPGEQGENVTSLQCQVMSDMAKTLFMTEGMLHPWRTIRLPNSNIFNDSVFSGFGGELLRGGFAKSHSGEPSLNRDYTWLSNFFLRSLIRITKCSHKTHGIISILGEKKPCLLI